jgi:ankyrin repeat protein
MSKFKTTVHRLKIWLVLFSLVILFTAGQQADQQINNIPVKVLSERHAFGTRFIDIQLLKSYYSKENLEQIWRFYCEKYPDKKDKLDVRIYVETDNSRSGLSQERGFDAIFNRQGEGAAAGGGDNEFYTYRPNLDEPEEKENIQLNGRYPFLLNSYIGNIEADFVTAAQKGDWDKLETFFKQGQDVNTRDEKGRSALMAACRSGEIEIVKILLAKGADINAKDKAGDTPLHEAVMAVIKDSSQKDGWRWGHPGIVKSLLDSGADVNAQSEGWTPLLIVASHGNNDIVEMLLKKGADLNAKTGTGMTALARALYDGKTETAKVLLEAGADVNTKDEDGYTPLMRTVEDSDMVRLLLAKGADVNAKNSGGETALAIAKKRPHNESVILLLLKYGAKE